MGNLSKKLREFSLIYGRDDLSKIFCQKMKKKYRFSVRRSAIAKEQLKMKKYLSIMLNLKDLVKKAVHRI